jgi:tetratricopeptide (TPR) repeat protein
VRYVLEGSVRKGGERIRISAQLIDAKLGNHIWAEKYDRNLTDLFDLQEEITRSVVASVAPEIFSAEAARASRLRQENLQAYELAMQSRWIMTNAFREGDPNTLRDAMDIAEEALRLDSRSIEALAALANGHNLSYLYRWGSSPDTSLVDARDAAERIRKFSPMDSRGFRALGGVKYHCGEFDGALADLNKAHELNPNDTDTLYMLAIVEAAAGLPEAASTHANLAIRLSPRDPRLGNSYLALAIGAFASEDYSTCIRFAEKAIQMQTKAPMRRGLLIASLAELGDLERARAEIEHLNNFSPNYIKNIVDGKTALFKHQQDNRRYIAGLSKAGLPE